MSRGLLLGKVDGARQKFIGFGFVRWRPRVWYDIERRRQVYAVCETRRFEHVVAQDMRAQEQKSESLVGQYYERHHIEGGRLEQALLEDVRARLFTSWIAGRGEGQRVLDLGGRDGTLTRHFVAGNDVLIGDIDQNAMQIARETHRINTAERRGQVSMLVA